MSPYTSRTGRFRQPRRRAAHRGRRRGFDGLLGRRAHEQPVNRFDIELDSAPSGPNRPTPAHFHAADGLRPLHLSRRPRRGCRGASRTIFGRDVSSPFLNFQRPILAARCWSTARPHRAARPRPRGRVRRSMFPWQSARRARETQAVHLNPKSGRWLPDHSRNQAREHRHRLQRRQHYMVPAATPFLVSPAPSYWSRSPLLGQHRHLQPELDATRSWRDGARRVPRAYPTHRPDAQQHYTNVMAVWVLQRAGGAELLPRTTAGGW